MGLFIRMVLYALAAGAAGYEIGHLDMDTSTYSINLDAVADAITATAEWIALYLGTFLTSRWAKARNWLT